MIKPLKPRLCSECKEPFTPMNSLTKVCGMACALDFAEKKTVKAKKKKEKEFDKETVRMKREKNDKDPSFWSDKAQTACNQYIMLRDTGKPCISCKTESKDIDYCAGHYIPRGRSAALRFNEFNIHRQCNNFCNLKNSGNLTPYRQALVKLYGEEKVLWLEGPHEMPRYRIDDYKRIYAEFKSKAKELRNI